MQFGCRGSEQPIVLLKLQPISARVTCGAILPLLSGHCHWRPVYTWAAVVRPLRPFTRARKNETLPRIVYLSPSITCRVKEFNGRLNGGRSRGGYVDVATDLVTFNCTRKLKKLEGRPSREFEQCWKGDHRILCSVRDVSIERFRGWARLRIFWTAPNDETTMRSLNKALSTEKSELKMETF